MITDNGTNNDPFKKFLGEIGKAAFAAGGVDLVKQIFKGAVDAKDTSPAAEAPAYGSGAYAPGVATTVTSARDDLLFGLAQRAVTALETIAQTVQKDASKSYGRTIGDG